MVKVMSDYQVSVLISSYNYAHIICETFESIRNQTFNFDDIEVIFVDDKSSDNSVEVIQKFVDEYDNVKLYSLLKEKEEFHFPVTGVWN